jgi:predicted ATP-grasp superfamily ATP-dependent carboligase
VTANSNERQRRGKWRVPSLSERGSITFAPRAARFSRTSRQRVLLLDADGHQALAACRSLGLSGHDVGVCVSGDDRMAAHSRFASGSYEIPHPRGDASAFAAAVETIVYENSYDVIVAIHDWTITRLLTHDRPLPAPCFPLVAQSAALLMDKSTLTTVCEDAGVAYPATVVLDPSIDIGDAVASVGGGGPVIVKAARSAEATVQRVAYLRGAVVAAHSGEAAAAVRALRDEGLVPILQERIDAAEKLNAVVMRRDGASELRYAHRVLREVPITGGVGIALQTIDARQGAGAEAVDILERLCAATGHDGIAQAEMYRSKRDGLLYVVDVNPRLWGSIWFAERLGLRVLERGVSLALGLPPPAGPVEYPLGKRCHHILGEWRWIRSHDRPRDALRDVLRTTRPSDVFEADLFADPKPLIRLAGAGLTGHVSRRTRSQELRGAV